MSLDGEVDARDDAGAPSPGSSVSNPHPQNVGGNVNDFGTSNRKEGIEEGDINVAMIIPVDIYAWENEADRFHGFKVYVATADSITEYCSIETRNQNSDGDYCSSILVKRCGNFV